MEKKMESGGGGGEVEPKEEQEEGAVTALERFPDEVWRKILCLLDEPKDFISVSRTCYDLNCIVEKYRLTWVPPLRMVLPFVARYLSKGDILVCRQVSRRICHDVENFLWQHPFRRFFPNPEYDPGEVNMGLTLDSETYHDDDKAEDFLEKFENHYFTTGRRNPFVGRTLYLNLSGDAATEWKPRIHARFTNNMIDIIFKSRPVRGHIRFVKINCDFQIGDPWLLRELVQKICRLRQIQSLVVEIRDCYLSSCDEERIWGGSLGGSLPAVGHSGPISITLLPKEKNYDMKLVNQDIVNDFHHQLVKFSLDFETSRWFRKQYQCRHLTSLTLLGVTFSELRLGQFRAPQLEELTLNWFKDWIPDASKDYIHSRPGEVNVQALAEVLKHLFRKLRVLKLLHIHPTVRTYRCLWDSQKNSCIANGRISRAEKEAVKKHDRAHHINLIWQYLSPHVKEFHMNTEKFLRPSS